MAHDKDYKERLIAVVKKEVKQVMEESVTRKFVHEESGSVTSLCGAVEACLSQGLRRRALGLFKTSSTTALLHKIAKHSQEAAHISQRLLDLEKSDPTATSANRRSSSSSDSLTKPHLKKHASLSSVIVAVNQPLPKYLWIRLALFEKQLAKIIEYLVRNASRYYEKEALVADPDYGTILSSLLVGPCALDYTRVKSLDNFYTDPPADELVQRHRISSGGGSGGGAHATTPPSSRRGLAPTSRRPIQPNIRRSLNGSGGGGGAGSGSEDAAGGGGRSSAFEYVQTMHQNSRAALLFGKNNVTVMPPANANSHHINEPMPGYLSLHQTANGLTINWTPNQLMNGFADESQDKSVYWEYALHVRLDEIVYVHCHQESDTGGTVILVGQDGVQRPPILFPKGGHMLAFLSCLETGLLPRGRLDPPLWSHRSAGRTTTTANGKRQRRPLPALAADADADPTNNNSETTNTIATRDYVFRIIDSSDHPDMPKRTELMDTRAHLSSASGTKTRAQLVSTSTSSDSSCKSFSIEQQHVNGVGTASSAAAAAAASTDGGDSTGASSSSCIRAVCDSMKRQIISRAFYGWLAYCRHLSTVRTHLSGLVNAKIVHGDEQAERGITVERWSELCVDGVVSDYAEVYRLTYFGGIEHSLRKDIWPYLLGHYKFGTTQQQRLELTEETKQAYENTMSEWLAVEAIVRQRDKENQAQAHAKLSTGSAASASASEQPPPAGHLQGDHLSNEVFEDDALLSDDDDDDDDAGDDDDNEYSTREEDGVGAGRTTKTEGGVDLQQAVKKSRRNTIRYESDADGEDDADADATPPSDEQLAAITGTAAIHTNEESICDEVSELLNDTAEENQEEDEQVFSSRNDCYAEEMKDFVHNVIVTNASVDMSNLGNEESGNGALRGGVGRSNLDAVTEENNSSLDTCIETHGLASPAPSACPSPASSNGGVYTQELLETFGLNLHRIEKDVQRCDRNYWYFTEKENLDKLRNVMCTYVWEHLEIGYMQGMCDLVAPLLVIFNEESMTYACFCHLMERMVENFPNGQQMDCHFANMRSLIQILDAEMYELMHQHGDYTHFYFCYRWFLLDFKRELVYADVNAAWEVIWAAQQVASQHFVLFIALALLETYRDIILSNGMDFTDIIKFFNEMAERHDAKSVLRLARELVLQLQLLIENK